MIIGIIGAMPEEVDYLKEQISNPVCTKRGDREYIQGEISKTQVVLVYSKIGKVAAALTTTCLIEHFNVSCIIFSGVAGSPDDSVNIGDIIVGSKLCQYDFDASPLFSKFEIPLTGKKFFDCDKDIMSSLYEASKLFLSDGFKKIDSADVVKTEPKAVYGVIASGDQFISSNEISVRLSNEIENLMAFEMEGAAASQVCSEYNISFGVLRVISDKSNEVAHVDFNLFINRVAKFYLSDIIKHFLVHYRLRDPLILEDMETVLDFHQSQSYLKQPILDNLEILECKNLHEAFEYAKKNLKKVAKKNHVEIHESKPGLFLLSRHATEAQPYGPYVDRLCHSEDPVSIEAEKCHRLAKKLSAC